MDNKTETNFEDFINKGKISSRGKWIAAAVVFVFFVALILVSIDWVLGALVHTRKEVKVPDITQKPVTAALNALAGANLALSKRAWNLPRGFPPVPFCVKFPLPAAPCAKDAWCACGLAKAMKWCSCPPWKD